MPAVVALAAGGWAAGWAAGLLLSARAGCRPARRLGVRAQGPTG
jgi:hypothetical protein